MSQVTFIGHGSLKFVTNDGKVIYVDPFFKGDYSQKPDYVLVTHEHFDHMNLSLLDISENTFVLMPYEALKDQEYQSFEHNGVKITSVPAYNKTHKKEECVGYILEFDDLKIYCAGDTSTTDYMLKIMSKLKLDYTFLATDGIYNMGPKEASFCANMIKAQKGNFPIHNDPRSCDDMLFYETGLDDFDGNKKIILRHGESFNL